MLAHCPGCEKHIYNKCPKKLAIMTNKKLKENQDVLIVWLINRFLIE